MAGEAAKVVGKAEVKEGPSVLKARLGSQKQQAGGGIPRQMIASRGQQWRGILSMSCQHSNRQSKPHYRIISETEWMG